MTKDQKTYNKDRIISSINTARKTEQGHAKGKKEKRKKLDHCLT